jgi:hypothetical protein
MCRIYTNQIKKKSICITTQDQPSTKKAIMEKIRIKTEGMQTIGNKKSNINTSSSVITLNLNGLMFTMKRHRLVEWIKKQDLTVCYQPVTLFRSEGIHRLKLKVWKMYSIQMITKRERGEYTNIRQNRFKVKTL